MYLKKIVLTNIKCFDRLEVDFSQGQSVRRWTTFFGENGLGKSTLLQALGVVLAGPSAVRELMPTADGWVRKNAPYGEIQAELLWSEGDAAPRGGGRTIAPYQVRYIVGGNDPTLWPESLRSQATVSEVVAWSGEDTPKTKEKFTKDRQLLMQLAYAENQPGWLACGYGPFRRLSGGAEASNTLVAKERRSARFVTLFREDAAITNATEWLIALHNAARENDVVAGRTLATVKQAIAQNLFPEPAELTVTSKSALLKRNGHAPFAFQDLSDGFRSMLALSVDLLRWLTAAFPTAPNPLNCPGVVLIDELDTHLHPSWQRTIGHWLREKFPNIQFVVATHSPFLAQVADAQSSDDPASVIFQYPGNIVLQRWGEASVQAQPASESMQQMSPEQIYQSELFDMDSLLSPPTEAKIAQYAALRQQDQLSPADTEQLALLQHEIENIPTGLLRMERAEERQLKKQVRASEALIKEIQ